MSDSFRDRAHLFRAGGLLVGLLVLFLVVRGLFVPEGFGAVGHYRVGALEDNRARPVAFAGQPACADCHSDVLETKAQGKHARVHCEACHGPLARHSEAPDEVSPELPDPRALCVRCHTKNVAKPAGFPQVDPPDHAGDEACNACHTPHSPEVE